MGWTRLQIERDSRTLAPAAHLSPVPIGKTAKVPAAQSPLTAVNSETGLGFSFGKLPFHAESLLGRRECQIFAGEWNFPLKQALLGCAAGNRSLRWFVILHIGRVGREMCRLAADLLQQAQLNQDLARRARRDAVQRTVRADKARLLQHAAELDELARALMQQARNLAPFGVGCAL
jgi:hypothetical protein